MPRTLALAALAIVLAGEAPPKPKCGDGMVLIPGGRYRMVSGTAEIEVKPFCLDLHEATADEYFACLIAGKCTRARLDACNGPTIEYEGRGNHPIACVDFAQAEAYCSYRKKRLARDEEWEWAARGGRKASEFPWGNDAPGAQLCWSGNGVRKQTCAVGLFPGGANPWGVDDLAGNVAEWTTTRDDDRIDERAARGGSWRDDSRAKVRAGRPGWFKRDYKSAFVGFRCAK